MSLVDRLAAQFRAELVGQVISVVSGAVLTIVLARLLDPDAYGLLFLAISIFAVAKIFSELGIARSAARYITEYKETDPGQLTHILRFSFLLNSTVIVVVSLVLLVTYEDRLTPFCTSLNPPFMYSLPMCDVLFIIY